MFYVWVLGFVFWVLCLCFSIDHSPLTIHVPNVQVSDTTGDATYTEAHYIINNSL